MSRVRWLVTVGIVVSSFGLSASVGANGSQNSQLGQTVEPITCVYTTTATGDYISSSTDCDSLVAATLDIVEPRKGRPLLGGTVTDTGLIGFRVWVGGVWFSYGSSPYLDISGTTWTLDLSALTTPISAGDYTIVLEERIVNDFLLRSVYEEVLQVPITEITRTDTDDGKRVTSSFSSESDQIISETISPFVAEPLEQRFLPDAQQIIAPYGGGIYTVDPVPGSPSQRALTLLVGASFAVGVLVVAVWRFVGFGWAIKR